MKQLGYDPNTIEKAVIMFIKGYLATAGQKEDWIWELSGSIVTRSK